VEGVNKHCSNSAGAFFIWHGSAVTLKVSAWNRMLLVATTLQLGQMLIVAKPSTNAWLLHRLQDLEEGTMPEAVCTSRFLLTALS
jgi:hypothetical protein